MSCKGKLKTSHDRQTKLMFRLTEQPGRKQEVQEQGCQGRRGLWQDTEKHHATRALV